MAIPLAELQRKRLLPERHPQGEIFLCDIGDAALKSDQASMEHPIFSLSTKPDMETKTYQHGDVLLEVKPGADGRATIYDKDILIFVISQLMAAKNAGRQINREVKFSAYDLLVFTNRMTNGGGYEGLKAALARLDGTRLRTTIKTGDEEEWKAFGLIEGATVKRKTLEGRVTEWGVTISEWLFRAVEANQVLKMDPGYFRIRKSIDRRVYEIARKHCGEQSVWRVGLETLLKKTGSKDTLRKFRMNIRELSQADILPTYKVHLNDDDVVVFAPREVKPKAQVLAAPSPLAISETTRETARLILEGWDVRVVEQEWRTWIMEKGIEVSNPDALFMKFCTSWTEKRGKAV